MHLPHGAVTPACAIYGAGIATAMTGFAVFAARKVRLAHPWRLAFATAAVFAAQALNIRLLPESSGHLVGAFLLAYYFGSAWSSIAMTLVLAMQACLYGDGALTTLGLNITNMAILPCWIVYPIWKRFEPGLHFDVQRSMFNVRRSFSLFTAAALSILLPTLALSLQLNTTATILPHLPVALLEAAATVGVILIARHARPIAIPAALLLLLAAAFGSSPYPDGLEISLARLGLQFPEPASFFDYSFLPLLAGAVLLALCLRAATHLSTNTRGETL